MKKYKMTGCARFFIFIIVFVPALYFGVSFFNGEDGLQNIKDFLNIESNDGPNQSKSDTKDFISAQNDLNIKNQLINELNKQIEILQELNKEKELEILELKKLVQNQK